MKRALTVLAGMALILGSAACSTDSTPSPAPSSTTAPSVTTAASSTKAAPASATSVPPQPTTDPGQRGADGSTGNNLGAEYCAKNQDPGCPLGSYVGPDAMQNPNGDGTWVPCEGTICTNPNHGAGPGTTAPAETPAPVEVPSTTPQNSGQVEGAPCEGDGHWVHLDGDNAGHYGTEWLCQH
ncbi:hypothetical protein OG308_17895 [Nocardia salmonicida]|uniref:Lipoprotein n=1 Tax=Nocardia salmonicida TaxID=53431 RepID=A0ABZ1N031_9NOCA|nr:hypothetical protein [Nocardia salmonicida]